jgi:hypothetical protein
MENIPNEGTSTNDSVRKPDQEMQLTNKFNSAEYERWSAMLRHRQPSGSDRRVST